MTITAIFEAVAVFEEDVSNDELDEFLDANKADEYMPPSLSFPPHLLWMCCVDALATCARTPMKALIDHGFPAVLISSHLTEILCLMPQPLFKSLSVSGTFDFKKSHKSNPLVLTHYCRLHIQSPHAIWKSRALNAVICPNLHTDIILGLDFLVKNKIIVDADLCTVIAKESGYDLLNPPNAKSNQKLPIRSLHLQCKEEAQQIKSRQSATRKLRTLVHMELIALFKENFECFDMELFTMGTLNIITSIKTWIKQLAREAMLLKLDKKMKETYADQFLSNIPHVKDLPQDVFHHIKLLPGAPISVTHAYVCPCKYHARWKTLIDQHTAVGCIHPLSLLYASPLVIILKSDPTVLP